MVWSLTRWGWGHSPCAGDGSNGFVAIGDLTSTSETGTVAERASISSAALGSFDVHVEVTAALGLVLAETGTTAAGTGMTAAAPATLNRNFCGVRRIHLSPIPCQ